MQGLVYDAKTKKCRESKRKKKKKSPVKAKKSPTKAKKSPAKKASKAKKKTVAQLRKECKEQGLVYDAKTKKCRESKRKKKSKSPPKKAKSKRKVPGFFDARLGTGIEPEDEVITKYIKDTGKITGDILYVGCILECVEEYGIVIVDLSRKMLFETTEDFDFFDPSLMGDDEIKELTQHYSLLKNSKKAVKKYIAWYKENVAWYNEW